MRLSQGSHTVHVTTGGPTTVIALVGPNGLTLSLGAETYHWSEEDGAYVGDHVNAAFDPKPDNTMEGWTGSPPNVYHFTGNWQ